MIYCWGYKHIWKKCSESEGKTKTKHRLIAIVSEVQRRGINWGWAHKRLLRFDQVLLFQWEQQWQVLVCKMHRCMVHFSMCISQLRKSRLWIHNTGNSSERKIQQPNNFRKLKDGHILYMDDNFLVNLNAQKKTRKIHQTITIVLIGSGTRGDIFLCVLLCYSVVC